MAEQETSGAKDRQIRIRMPEGDYQLLMRLAQVHYNRKEIPQPTVTDIIRYLFQKDAEEVYRDIKEKRRKISRG